MSGDSACQKSIILLKFAPQLKHALWVPLTPSPEGRGKEGGCYRTLNPLSCGVLFGYIMGVVGGRSPPTCAEGATKINKISPAVRRKAHWLDGLF